MIFDHTILPFESFLKGLGSVLKYLALIKTILDLQKDRHFFTNLWQCFFDMMSEISR